MDCQHLAYDKDMYMRDISSVLTAIFLIMLLLFASHNRVIATNSTSAPASVQGIHCTDNNAGDPIAQVSYLKGSVGSSSDKSDRLQKGNLIYRSNTIRVSSDGFVALFLQNGISVNLQPSTVTSFICSSEISHQPNYFMADPYISGATRG